MGKAHERPWAWRRCKTSWWVPQSAGLADISISDSCLHVNVRHTWGGRHCSQRDAPGQRSHSIALSQRRLESDLHEWLPCQPCNHKHFKNHVDRVRAQARLWWFLQSRSASDRWRSYQPYWVHSLGRSLLVKVHQQLQLPIRNEIPRCLTKTWLPLLRLQADQYWQRPTKVYYICPYWRWQSVEELCLCQIKHFWDTIHLQSQFVPRSFPREKSLQQATH